MGSEDFSKKTARLLLVPLIVIFFCVLSFFLLSLLPSQEPAVVLKAQGAKEKPLSLVDVSVGGISHRESTTANTANVLRDENFSLTVEEITVRDANQEQKPEQ